MADEIKSDKYERLTYEKKNPEFPIFTRNLELIFTSEKKGLEVVKGGSVRTSTQGSAVIKMEIENC